MVAPPRLTFLTLSRCAVCSIFWNITAKGEVEADAVVLAGNAYSRFEPKHLDNLVFPAGSYIIATEPLPERRKRIEWYLQCVPKLTSVLATEAPAEAAFACCRPTIG